MAGEGKNSGVLHPSDRGRSRFVRGDGKHDSRFCMKMDRIKRKGGRLLIRWRCTRLYGGAGYFGYGRDETARKTRDPYRDLGKLEKDFWDGAGQDRFVPRGMLSMGGKVIALVHTLFLCKTLILARRIT